MENCVHGMYRLCSLQMERASSLGIARSEISALCQSWREG